MTTLQTVIFDTKSYERESLQRAASSSEIEWRFELARLLTFPNVLITAHQAFLTREALSEIARVTAANLIAFATGQPFLPETTLNAQPQLQ